MSMPEALASLVLIALRAVYVFLVFSRANSCCVEGAKFGAKSKLTTSEGRKISHPNFQYLSPSSFNSFPDKIESIG